MSDPRLRVLCMDIEGGYGGSSRSLYESLAAMDRSAVDVEVWCGRDGPIRSRYQALNIPCRVTPDMPKMNAWPRASRNLIGFSLLARDFAKWRMRRNELLDRIVKDFDLVHFNHEGLVWLARLLRKRHGRAQVIHVRTMMNDNFFGRCQARSMVDAADHLVFISENERKNFLRLSAREPANSVIYNIARPPDGVEPSSKVPRDGRLNVAVLANYAFVRGIDRAVEIATELKRRGQGDIRFVVAGDIKLPRGLDGELGQVARAKGTLADYVTRRGVADMFVFLGHVSEPERVLAACDVLIKPTRENNPWGRDILEALAAGKPVISIGSYSRFVESGVTGHLFAEYNAGAVADVIETFNNDRALIGRLGVNGARRIAALCDPSRRAGDLLAVWKQAVANRGRRGITA
jgi:glycosyltransferase involved in cell wall biosynthesis